MSGTNNTTNSTANGIISVNPELVGSAKDFVASPILINGVQFLAFVIAFTLLRLRLKRIYQPKSSFRLINDEKKPDPLPVGPWQWFVPLLKSSHNLIIQQAGLDGYFFIRYLYVFAAYSFVSSVWILPLLMPVNVQGGEQKDTLNRLSLSNLGSRQSSYMYAHVVVSLVYFWGLLFVIYRELTYYTAIRHAVLSSPRYAKKLSSRTVLFQSVPEQYLSETEFSKLFIGVKRIWITRAASELGSKVAERDNLAMQLEAAATAYLRTGVLRASKLKKKTGQSITDQIGDYVPEKRRPRHRARLLGKKVDTIDYTKEKLIELNKEIVDMQAEHLDARPFNSVFVEFESQFYAQEAQRSLPHHAPYNLRPAYVGIRPADIIWFNMRKFWFERIAAKLIAGVLITGVIILWAIPVTGISIFSQQVKAAPEHPESKWHMLVLPKPLNGILVSILPTALLYVLMMMVPIFIRRMAIFGGAPSVQHVEYYTQRAFFAFQVIQVFLIRTVSSAASELIPKLIDQPKQTLSLLAAIIPETSNFYLGYVITIFFSLSSGLLLQIVPLVLFYVLGLLFDKTARKQYERFTSLPTPEWGTLFAVYTNLAVIVMVFSITSPLILPLASVGFFATYAAYLYSLIYVYKESPDARGIHYPRALFQTLTGVYLSQIFLFLMVLLRKAWGPIVIQAICLAGTILAHYNMNQAFTELMDNVPVDTMKPLDGKSETPSFKPPPGTKIDDDVQELPPFPVRQYQTRNVSTDQKASSMLSEFTYEYYNKPGAGNPNTVATVPLLADGDVVPIPPAPFWKRYLLPHIYYSYRAVKTRLPEIYNLPDPEEKLTDEENALAYCYPAVSAKCPCLWLPRDPYGFSKQLITYLEDAVSASDEGAEISADGKINILDDAKPPEAPSETKAEKSGPEYL
ncbi:AaceriAER282Wp [[Ashbya] aceris (nom. inval.)]|nr:AaceriAER282Wp [[Ashbya] aceris (nom. inval.)]